MYVSTRECRVIASPARGELNSHIAASWKSVFEPITGYDVISDVDSVMYVVLSKAEKHGPYRELVGTIECVTGYAVVQLVEALR
jgi:hypothetical protein